MTSAVEELFRVRQESLAVSSRALIEVLHGIYRGRGTFPEPHVLRIKKEADELSGKGKFHAANELYDFVIDEMRRHLG